MAIEKMLTTEEEKKNMLETIVMHAFDMLRQGVNINPALDISNQKKRLNTLEKLTDKDTQQSYTIVLWQGLCNVSCV